MKLPYIFVGLALTLVACRAETTHESGTGSNNDETQVIEESYVAETFPELLMELEQHVKWSAVDGAWAARRDSWGQDCYDAVTTQEKAKFLLEFEAHILWDAVDQKWASVRDHWSQECLAATSDQDLGGSLKTLESYILWTSVDDAWKEIRPDWLERVNAIQP